jgi:hypothetical protein
VFGRHQYGRAEAFHLQRPVELVGEHCAQTVGCEHRERDEARRRHRDERNHDGHCTSPSPLPPEVGDCDWEENRRPQLGGEAEPEQDPAGDRPLPDDRRQRAEREQRGPQVEPRVEQ